VKASIVPLWEPENYYFLRDYTVTYIHTPAHQHTSTQILMRASIKEEL
jgi:hypothetical protein